MIFLTADWHLGDERLHLFPRPFSSADDCAKNIIENYNKVVSDDDTVYFVGDVAVKEDALHEYMNELPGKKILIKGNYDKFDLEVYKKYFDSVSYFEDVTFQNDEGEGVDCRVVHYPSQSIPERFNLVGHIHGSWRVQKNMLNVGVDVWHFAPVSSEMVLFKFNAIKNFYDQDVWVGDHEANIAHNERGKEGTYWENNFGGTLNA